jgi:hypothetical protein
VGNEGLHVDAATAKHVQAQWVCVAVPEYTKNVHFPIKHKQTLKMLIHVTGISSMYQVANQRQRDDSNVATAVNYGVASSP